MATLLGHSGFPPYPSRLPRSIVPLALPKRRHARRESALRPRAGDRDESRRTGASGRAIRANDLLANGQARTWWRTPVPLQSAIGTRQRRVLARARNPRFARLAWD